MKKDNIDRERQGKIMDSLIIMVIIIIVIAILTIFCRMEIIKEHAYQKDTILEFFLIPALIFFSALLRLSKKGYKRYIFHLFPAALLISAIYFECHWGVNSVAGILLFILAIAISEIVINNLVAIISTIFSSLLLIAANQLQKTKIIPTNQLLSENRFNYSDIILLIIVFFIIITISWILNNELKKSKKELEKERDSLETKIAEKTKELKDIQTKEIARVYRFAEFGKLSGGLFHDLVNPLTTVMLNINKIKDDGQNNHHFDLIKPDIEQIIKASKKMRQFINSVRKQIDSQEKKEIFSLNKEIVDSISILNHKALKNQIAIFFKTSEKILIKGNPIKFSQIITNLISNALDALENNQTDRQKEIIISLKKQEKIIILSVSDNGPGIPENIRKNIFQPFFTTKSSQGGLGLGLPLIKKIIEENFLGQISFSSDLNKKTSFLVTIPKNIE